MGIMNNLLQDCKITRVENAVAAGTDDTTASDAIDMSGYDGVVFIALFGTLTASQVTSMKAQQDTASAMSTAADLEGSSVGPLADDDDNQCLVLDVYRPRERYVRVVITRATANAVIDGVIAIQYRSRKGPVTQDASVAFAEQLVSPAEGTA